MRNYFEGILPKPVDDLYHLFIKERNTRRLSRGAFPLLEELEKYSDTSRYVPSLREMLIVRVIDAVCSILFFSLILLSLCLVCQHLRAHSARAAVNSYLPSSSASRTSSSPPGSYQ